jgi:hypothetical protein
LADTRALQILSGAVREIAVAAASAIGASAAIAILTRLALRIVSWFDGVPFTQFTWRGTWVVFKVVFLATVLVGFLFALVRPRLPGHWVFQGLVFGSILLLYPGLFFLFGSYEVDWMFLMRRPATLSWPHVLSVRALDFARMANPARAGAQALFAFLLIGYGIIVAAVSSALRKAGWRRRVRPPPGGTPRSGSVSGSYRMMGRRRIRR